MDNGARHSFFAAKLAKKFQMTVILGTSMLVTMADSSQVTTSETHSVPIIHALWATNLCIAWFSVEFCLSCNMTWSLEWIGYRKLIQLLIGIMHIDNCCWRSWRPLVFVSVACRPFWTCWTLYYLVYYEGFKKKCCGRCLVDNVATSQWTSHQGGAWSQWGRRI